MNSLIGAEFVFFINSLAPEIVPLLSRPQFIEEQILKNKISILDIKPWHCYNLAALPFYHRDPFDRMIIVQAQYEKHG
jgi:PIN domain nuclease of toxin-antitoxin system